MITFIEATGVDIRSAIYNKINALNIKSESDLNTCSEQLI